MTSCIVRTTERGLFSLLLLASFWILLRGHDQPGGGFVGGLVAASAHALRTLAWGPRQIRNEVRVHPETLALLGMLIATATGLVPFLIGHGYLKSYYLNIDLGSAGSLSLGTTLLFDTGVYLAVFGGVLAVVSWLTHMTSEP
jgi:multicomponent Na+:H+ antiporter subunit B